jgi:hypothetical protein
MVPSEVVMTICGFMGAFLGWSNVETAELHSEVSGGSLPRCWFIVSHTQRGTINQERESELPETTNDTSRLISRAAPT